ncbi:hypothetical protein VHEMI07572 [[Torrubiella] hemipterigena]|uniref:Uncharacterized protein n=1 Tax=[Torrubiella] hemipterigena TaxID=1531966 RepID=A0A0A1TN62_9HYPO|nr:hypothetical protein VHEMI07572 [[Torrubiella] hemipterigena]
MSNRQAHRVAPMATPCDRCHTTAAETLRMVHLVDQKVDRILANGSATTEAAMEAATMGPSAANEAVDDSPPAVDPTSGTQSATASDTAGTNINRSRRSRVPVATQHQSQALPQEPVDVGTSEQPTRRNVSSSLSNKERSYQDTTNASRKRCVLKN